MDISKSIAHLYETEHNFEDSTTGNLVPKLFHAYTVANGEMITSATINPLVNRDIYLAEIIGNLKDELDNKYQGSDSIEIDKEKWTISVKNTKPLIFEKGFKFYNLSKTVYLNVSEKYNNEIFINPDNNSLTYTALNEGPKTTAEPVIFDTTANNYFLYKTGEYKDLETIEPNNYFIFAKTENTNLKYITAFSGINQDIKSITATIKSKGSDVEPPEVLYENGKYDKKERNIPFNFDPTRVDPIETNQTAKHYNSTDLNINMCPTGTLYIW